MKIKTDLYTKIILTAIAIFLAMIAFKDINFVSKAQASPLDLSGMKVEDVSDDEGTTFFVYENEKIEKPFDANYNYDECEIYFKDVPTHIITNKKVRSYSSIKIKKGK